MLSSGALPQTLGSITTTKINELSKQRALFEKRRAEIVEAAENASSLRSKAQILLEGVTKLKGFPNDALDQEDLDEDKNSDIESAVEDRTERALHVNIRRFLLQSQYDPSVSDRSLKSWISHLEEELQYLQLRHKHAKFYSSLVTEWLGDLETPSATTDDEEQQGAGFENVRRTEMQQQRETWESLVFTEADVDASAVRAYLEGLFEATTPSKQALTELRDTIRSIGIDFTSKSISLDVDDLKWVSESLLRSDLLTKEKTAILKEFMRNPAVSQEVVDVLNMRLASLDNWGWPAGCIPVEMRRQLNGKYRVFMDEDLLDGLMFQYLGTKWSVTFRSAFNAFLDTPAWKFLREHIPRPEISRRSNFTASEASQRGTSCVNNARKKMYKDDYFMTLLPSSVEQGNVAYDGDGGDARDSSLKKDKKNALETKHSLLHLLITESLVYTSLHGEFTAIRSDVKWFGPSLAHSTILTVLEYFGVPQYWLNFFRTFLETPIKFVQDGPDGSRQIRKRGVPMSHALSDCFGETVLFCMDFAVNQSTDGAYLYRLHDDFWFWGEEETCVKAWATMTEFTKVMGLAFNEEKTGTVRLVGKDAKDRQSQQSTDTVSPDPLPKGEIRWGFLRLDPLEGHFVIDQEQVDNHISELKRQLSSCKSVFSWVQAWNSYFGRFFANNFAKPAMCFGRSHIDMAISTLSRIERTLFADSNSGVTDHLRQVLADRFGVEDLPEGFFYFPVEFGGLELLNPYISFLAMREGIKMTPHGRLQKAFLQYEVEYHTVKERFEKEATASFGPHSDMDGLSLEEYTRYPETYSRPLLNAYNDLIRVPEEVSVNQTPALHRNQMALDRTVITHTKNRNIISNQWFRMSPYWQWTAELYQDEMVKTYGCLAAVNREFMPLGVIKTLKEGKFRWQS
ncbi:hypothetical protein BO70DRAFT_363450 [Aspergillus heteromorphus CBS 117.55]|uniref:Reverse transcriptase domain-containing protein n=1 Tax=Aspergillus heteromorphus CBS 117.55 TaxID=1448321 RepID=A0A317VW32_9EURO|nr:uncharacterized protein BO70DRAFT_363450 [Aspergillus heteromorphus CBS 117.55]PWY77511.1 hypothetical protein BO70DRAFT_363450 [Aspergillus heteromorphus CBS 117.55]